MDVLETFEHVNTWSESVDALQCQQAVTTLEDGCILYFPNLAFVLQSEERAFLTPDCTDGKSKNVSYDPRGDAVRGTCLQGRERARLTDMMRRYGDFAQAFLLALIPAYGGGLERARTSYRPVEIEGRSSSNKKDDTRLHVDAFPSRPNHGRRIMRMFTNINPRGQPRVWHVGEPFEPFARRFLPTVPRQVPGSARVMQWTGITRARRSRYDHTMLNLHDHGKLDDDYQTSAPQTRIEFPPGATWIVYTDQVLHAALAGQYVLEQTFHLSVDSLADPQTSPLRRLERLTGRPLL